MDLYIKKNSTLFFSLSLFIYLAFAFMTIYVLLYIKKKKKKKQKTDAIKKMTVFQKALANLDSFYIKSTK